MIKTAMILSAGLGHRLRPLSLTLPKPLFEVMNKTMLQWWAELLFSAGVKQVIINTHYQTPLMLEGIAGLASCFSNQLEIIPSPEEELIGTGGGIKRAAHLLGKNDFLVVNADIFTDFDLVKLALKHLSNPGRLATLGLLNSDNDENVPPGNVSIGEEQRILNFRQPKTVEGEISRQTYCGVMALSPQIFDLIPEGPADIIEVFIQALGQGYDIFGWNSEPAIWRDMGTQKAYWGLNRDLASGRLLVHSSAQVLGQLQGWNVIGALASIEAESLVKNSVIWPGAVVGKGSTIEDAVVCGQVPPGTIISGGVFCEPK